MNIYGCIISMLTIAVEAGDWNRDGVTDLYFGIFRGADINDKRNEVKVAGTPFRRHNAWQANCNNGTLFRSNTLVPGKLVKPNSVPLQHQKVLAIHTPGRIFAPRFQA